MTAIDSVPEDIDALKSALIAERTARLDAEARTSRAEALVAQLKLMIARLKRDRFGASSERGRKLLDQLELQLEELEAAATEDAAKTIVPTADTDSAVVRSFTRRKPVRAPLPEHLPRERVVLPGPTACPLLWWSSGQAGRGHHRDLGGDPPAVESGADRPGKIHLPVL